MAEDRLPGTFFGPSTIVELLRHRARCQAQDVAYTLLLDGEEERFDLTYEALDRQARAIGAWLETHGLVGQRALLLYPPGAEFIAAFFGCMYAGVVAVPVYPPRRNRSLTRIQAISDDCDARVALTTRSVLERVELIIDETPHLKQLTWLATSDVPLAAADDWQPPDVHGDTLAFLQYTSGSTGTPKGVMLTHANLVHNSALISHAFEHTRSGSGVFWLPSYHDMGLIGGILQPMYVGRPNVLMSAMSFLQKPYRWLSAITRFRGTTSGGPNFAYDLCVEKITLEQRATLDLSSWRVAFNGAEPVRADTIDAFCETFEPCGFRREAFYPCFGLAEATLIVSGGYAFNPPAIRAFDAAAIGAGKVRQRRPTDHRAVRLVGCGQNLPDQQIAVVDPETMLQVGGDEIGEVWVRGPSVAQGYWNRPDATEATFRAYLADTGEGPFLRTGDLGFLVEGELFVTGRIKDLIIVHGVNHYPQDIEHTVEQSHERLRRDSGAAFSVPVDGRDELVLVHEIERHRHADFAAIFEAIRRAVAVEHDLHPHAIVLLKAGSIPKTSSGKIQRHACREGFLESSLTVVGQWTADGSVVAALPKQEAGAATDDDSPLAEPAARPTSAIPSSPRGGSVAAAPRPASAASGNGSPPALKQRTIDAIVEEIQAVGKQRVAGLTIDTPIVETGLDSLERMEILASIEERFGGRFPQEIYADLETVRDLANAVEKYIGNEPRDRATAARANVEIPRENYHIAEFPECVQLQQTLGLIDLLGVKNPYFAQHQGVTTDRTVVDGRELISFATYNYIGMSGDPAVHQGCKDAVDRYGSSTSASRLVAGEKPIHRELEQAIAGKIGVDDAIALVSGHGTNETTIGHLFGPGDLILHDALAHNSIVQGSILSGARRRPFAHNDYQAADRLLSQYRHEYRRVVIIIEGVYSMDGDIPDLPPFIEVKKRHKALLMIDEAHSMGVLGKHGWGIREEFGINAADVDVWMGTLSKALGSSGAYIAGCKELIQYLKYTAPGFVFSGGIVPPVVGAALAAIRLLEREPQRVVRLHQNARLFLSLARARGLNTGTSHGTPVVPIIIGNSERALRLSRAMFERGINVLPILHPAVEEAAARLRFFITSMHNEGQIRHTVDVLAEELAKLDPEHVAAAR